MDNMNKNLVYWVAALLLSAAAILYLYKGSGYDNIKYNLTRNEAIGVAKNYVEGLGYDVSPFMVEAYSTAEMKVLSYLTKTLGNEKVNEIINDDKVYVYGWSILFHQNKKPGDPSPEYTVVLSNRGNVTNFYRDVPDTLTEKHISPEEARVKILKFLVNTGVKNLNEYSLIESKSDKKLNRTDYIYKWEKDSPEFKGKQNITVVFNGDKPGKFVSRFQIPAGLSPNLESQIAIYGTASFIFIFFLAQFAVFIFLRKYHDGEVWLRIGRNLFIIFYVFSLIGLINSWPSVGQNVVMGTDLLTQKVVVFLSIALLVFFLYSLLLFSAWSASESVSRRLWTNKLRGIDAFIKFRYFSLSSGNAIFRGMVLGSVFFLSYIILFALGSYLNDDIFFTAYGFWGYFNNYIPSLTIFLDSFTSALLSSVAIQFFVISFVYAKWKNKWLAIVASSLLAIVGNVIAQSAPNTHIFMLDILIDFIYGLIFGYIFFKFDLLTLVSTKFHIALISGAIILYSSDNAWYRWNFWVIILLLVSTIVIFIIARIRKEEFRLENYGVPTHVKKISERERMKKELEIASHVQLSLLPKEKPNVKGYDIAGFSLPAKEAGGDYYDFVKLDKNQLGVAIGDVSGKGVGAAIYMTLTKGILQAHAEENASPKVVLNKVNRLLYKTIEKNTFVSMFYSVLDTENHTLLYSRAGHNPGILCANPDGETRLLKSSGIALGLEEGHIFSKTLVEETISVASGDTIVLYTDGFTEAMNPSLEEYGEDRLYEIIKNNRSKSPSKLIEIITHDVNHFVEDYKQHDDMTIVIIQRNK